MSHTTGHWTRGGSTTDPKSAHIKTRRSSFLCVATVGGHTNLKTMLHDDYFEYDREARARHGAASDVAVLMEVGSFYELYGEPGKDSSARLQRVAATLA